MIIFKVAQDYEVLETQNPTKQLAFQCRNLFGTLFVLIFCNGADYALFYAIQDKFTLNLVLILYQTFNNKAETAPFDGAIWDISTKA